MNGILIRRMVSIDNNEEVVYGKEIVHRIARCTGHLRAVKTMVETGRDCSEVLIQLSAIKSEISGASRVILKQCITDTIQEAVDNNELEKIGELIKSVDLLMK